MPEQPLAKRVLLVDDEEMNLAALRRLLKTWSEQNSVPVEITERDNGAGALGVAQNIRKHGRSFDLVVTDNNMPQMTGLEFLRAFRAGGDTTPVLLISGDNKAGLLPEEVHSLHAEFMDKPLDQDALRALFDKTLRAVALPAILVVADDDADNREAVAQLIEDAFGGRVRILKAQHGQEILDLHVLHPTLSVVVTDKDMPRCDGLEATIRLRKRGSKIPVAIMTGRPHDEALIDGGTVYTYTVFPKGPRFVDSIIPWLKANIPSLA